MSSFHYKIQLHHHSPNTHLACNALYSMGIYPNVLVEEDMHNWRDTAFEEAYPRAKRHLIVNEISEYDGLIQKTLAQCLILHDGVYIWPDGMRAILFWWCPRK